MDWIEISVLCDGEAAEAVAELFNRFNSRPGEGQSGAVIEVGGFDAYGELAQPVVSVRTYLPADDAPRRSQIEQGLWFLGVHGANVLDPITHDIYGAAMAANEMAASLGQPLPYIMTKTFMDVFVFMGGSGTRAATDGDSRR